MPIYVYMPDSETDTGERFEIFQKMSDPPLTRHPETERPIRRVVTMPFVPVKYRPHAAKELLSDKNLDRMGFTKYVKRDKGGYEKAAGSGPDLLKNPPPAPE